MRFIKVAVLAVLAFVAVPVRAEVVSRFEVPIASAIINSCNGEVVAVSGASQTIVRSTETRSGNYIFGLHFDVGALRGVGESTGADYRVVDVFNVSFQLGLGETYTQQEAFRMIGQGPNAPTFIVNYLIHFTITPTGNFVTYVDNLQASCPGNGKK